MWLETDNWHLSNSFVLSLLTSHILTRFFFIMLNLVLGIFFCFHLFLLIIWKSIIIFSSYTKCSLLILILIKNCLLNYYSNAFFSKVNLIDSRFLIVFCIEFYFFNIFIYLFNIFDVEIFILLLLIRYLLWMVIFILLRLIWIIFIIFSFS